MRPNLASILLIFVSIQASAVMNAIEDNGPVQKLIKKSAVNLVNRDSTGEYSTRCSSVLVGRRYVLTAFHCVANGGSLWHEGPTKRYNGVEFFVNGSSKPKYVKVKSIDYPKALKDIHKYGRDLYRLMADLEVKIKDDVATETRMNLVIKLGGDVKAVSDYKDDQQFQTYLKTLFGDKSMDEQVALFEEFSKDAEKLLDQRIVSGSLPPLEAFLKEHGFDKGYAAFEKYVSDQDLALLTLEADAPSNYTPVKIGAAELREGSDIKGWIAGSGAFGKIGEKSSNILDGLKPIRLGTVKIATREGNHFLLRAGPSRICHGDSGGPLYVEDGKNVVLVGIHSAVNFADEQEHKNGSSQCTSDVATISIELSKFKELLKPVL